MCKSLLVSYPFTECHSTHIVSRFLCLIRVPSDLTLFLTLLGYNILSTGKELPNKYFPVIAV